MPGVCVCCCPACYLSLTHIRSFFRPLSLLYPLSPVFCLPFSFLDPRSPPRAPPTPRLQTGNDYAIHAAGVFRTNTPAPGGNGTVSVGTLVKLEANPKTKKYRCSVRAVVDTVAKGMCNVLVNQLGPQ
jgi:hypothetical protein